VHSNTQIEIRQEISNFKYFIKYLIKSYLKSNKSWTGWCTPIISVLWKWRQDCETSQPSYIVRNCNTVKIKNKQVKLNIHPCMPHVTIFTQIKWDTFHSFHIYCIFEIQCGFHMGTTSQFHYIATHSIALWTSAQPVAVLDRAVHSWSLGQLLGPPSLCCIAWILLLFFLSSKKADESGESA
jgi:hypothetical protein